MEINMEAMAATETNTAAMVATERNTAAMAATAVMVATAAVTEATINEELPNLSRPTTTKAVCSATAAIMTLKTSLAPTLTLTHLDRIATAQAVSTADMAEATAQAMDEAGTVVATTRATTQTTATAVATATAVRLTATWTMAMTLPTRAAGAPALLATTTAVTAACSAATATGLTGSAVLSSLRPLATTRSPAGDQYSKLIDLRSCFSAHAAS